MSEYLEYMQFVDIGAFEPLRGSSISREDLEPQPMGPSATITPGCNPIHNPDPVASDEDGANHANR